jgi:hypothetical protein
MTNQARYCVPTFSRLNFFHCLFTVKLLDHDSRRGRLFLVCSNRKLLNFNWLWGTGHGCAQLLPKLPSSRGLTAVIFLSLFLLFIYD